jgi:hypothetical protein
MPAADILAVAREQTRWFLTIADREHAEAVVLDLAQPIIAVEWRLRAFYNLKREVIRAEHATFLGKSGPALKHSGANRTNRRAAK